MVINKKMKDVIFTSRAVPFKALLTATFPEGDHAIGSPLRGKPMTQHESLRGKKSMGIHHFFHVL